MQKRSISDVDDHEPLPGSDNDGDHKDIPPMESIVGFDQLLADIEAPQPPSDTIIPPKDEFDHKLEIKSGLDNERANLLNKRSDIMGDIAVIRLKIKRLKEKRERIIADRRLDQLIEENNVQFIKPPTGLHSMDDNENKELLKLDVQPSNDWVERLRLINKFLRLTILEATMESGAVTRYNFKITCPYFNLSLTMTTNPTTEEVLTIDVGKKRDMRLLYGFSPYFNNLIQTDYLPTHNIVGLLYGLNSLVIVIDFRAEIFATMIIKFQDYIDCSSSTIAKVLKSPVKQNQKYWLRLMDNLEFTIPSGNNAVEPWKLQLSWKIIVKSDHLGECGSSINLILEKGQNIKDLTSIYQNLINDFGPIEALSVLFKNSFGLTV